MKIIVDCLTRVSSTRYNKKYRDKFIHEMDNKGKL